MKILIVGSYSHWNALEKHYVKYLSNYYTMDLYPFPDHIDSFRKKNIFNRIRYRFKLAIKKFLHNENLNLYNYIKNEKIDLVWIFKGLDIYPETLSKISKLGIKIINFNPDHPFIRTFKSGGGKEIEQCLPLYDLYLCYSNDLIKEIENRYSGRVKTAFLPFGFELSDALYDNIESDSILKEEKLKVCFIGNPDNELRRKTLNHIIENKIKLDIYGTNWDKFIKDSEYVRIFPGVYGDDYWRTLRDYRVQLNIFRPHNFNSHNMRTFEIPAVGGIQLAPWSDEHNMFFQNDDDIFLYKSDDDMIAKIKLLLELDKSKSDHIRIKARDKCLKAGYSYSDIAKSLVTIFNELYQKK